jgi:hypothetical protein
MNSVILSIYHQDSCGMFGVIIQSKSPYIRAGGLSHLMAGIPPAGASLVGVHKTRVMVTQSMMDFDEEFASEFQQYYSPFLSDCKSVHS